MSGNYDEDNDNDSMMMMMMMMTLQKTQKVGSFFPLRLIGLLPRNPGGKN